MSAKAPRSPSAAPKDEPIRVAIVDDHWLSREALCTVLAGMSGYEVAFCAEHGEDYIRRCKEHGAPNIALIDLLMPVMDGWVTIAWIREHQMSTRPVAITFDPLDEYVRLAWKAGASAVLPKASRQEELITALGDVYLTGFHRNELVQMRLVQKPVVEMERVKTANEKLNSLSDREHETLVWMADPAGYTAREIGRKMKVEKSTVESYCHIIYEKLGLKNRAQAVALAVEHKLVMR